MIINKLTIASLLAVCLLFTTGAACKHQQPLTVAQNIQMSGDQALNSIANGLEGITDTTIALHSAKPLPLLTDALAGAILKWDKQALVVTKEAQTAFAAGTDTATRTAAVLRAVNAVKQLPPEVRTFVSNPIAVAGAQALATSIQILISFVQNMQVAPVPVANLHWRLAA